MAYFLQKLRSRYASNDVTWHDTELNFTDGMQRPQRKIDMGPLWTQESWVHLCCIYIGVRRSFSRPWVRMVSFVDVWERLHRILKNMDHTDVKIKCDKIRAQLCQGSSAMPTLNEPFRACLSVQRRAAPFPVYACAEFHIRELASSRRFFRTPQEIFSLKWLIIYHLSKPLEFC